MGCCGQKRTAFKSAPAIARKQINPNPPPESLEPPIARPQSAPVPPSGHAPKDSFASIRYTSTTPVLVTGPATGRHYHFSGSRPVQAVDLRDVEALLRTGFFRNS